MLFPDGDFSPSRHGMAFSLPTVIVLATMRAYVGPKTLASMVHEWGVDVAAEPGGEVDPGLLQFKRVIPGNADVDGTGTLAKEGKTDKLQKPWNRGTRREFK